MKISALAMNKNCFSLNYHYTHSTESFWISVGPVGIIDRWLKVLGFQIKGEVEKKINSQGKKILAVGWYEFKKTKGAF